jgi:unsaturated rhamnogalacturonyl hydrolase
VLVATGIAELLRILPKNSPNYGKIMDVYKKMLTTLLHYQTTDGMWLLTGVLS